MDLLDKEPRDAKRDIRLKESGDLVTFEFDGERWPILPRTSFYDWLYVNAISQNPKLADELIQYDGFSDIEFNPEKSLNCQASSAALFVALVRRQKLENALSSPQRFQDAISGDTRDTGPETVQGQLL